MEEERVKIKTLVTVEKYRNEKDFLEGKSYKKETSKHNVILNEGANAIWTLVCGGMETAFDNAHARVGVGNSGVSEAKTQSGLQGMSTKFVGMDTGYPQFGTLRKMVFKGIFEADDGNFAWEEYSVDNGVTPNKNLNRKVVSHGTKTVGEVWTLTITFTLA